jgi:hypothetical protein
LKPVAGPNVAAADGGGAAEETGHGLGVVQTDRALDHELLAVGPVGDRGAVGAVAVVARQRQVGQVAGGQVAAADVDRAGEGGRHRRAARAVDHHLRERAVVVLLPLEDAVLVGDRRVRAGPRAVRLARRRVGLGAVVVRLVAGDLAARGGDSDKEDRREEPPAARTGPVQLSRHHRDFTTESPAPGAREPQVRERTYLAPEGALPRFGLRGARYRCAGWSG